MSDSLIPIGAGGLGVVAAYLGGLILLGWFGYRARRENTLRDFYLAGPGIGFLVLVLTLYATQYSGNTLFGFSGAAYRRGLGWLVCLHFMTAIVVVYQAYGPALYRLARQHQFLTPTDFLEHRFASPALNMIAPAVMIFALGNFLVAQMMAMGRVVQGFVDISPIAAYVVGVMLLAGIIAVYETMGGFRAVAWTDVMQGIVLMIGFICLFS